MKLNWNFLGTGRVQTKKSILGGGMDISWTLNMKKIKYMLHNQSVALGVENI